MKTTFILHGGESGRDNEHDKKFYRSWVESFDENFVPKILLIYFSRKPEEYDNLYQQDTERFAKYNDNRKANFEIASQDLEKLRQQIKKSDVIYVRGGSSELLLEKIKPLGNELAELIQGKVYVGSSAGVILISKYARSASSNRWKEGLGLLPIVSVVHWSSAFQEALDKFKAENKENDFEYILVPETEFVIKKFEI